MATATLAPTLAPVPPLSWAGDAETGGLLDVVDPGPESRVVLIGPGSLDLGCALMRAGSVEVAFVRLGECPRDLTADVVVVPAPPCLDAASRAAVLGTRLLAPLGRIAFGGLEPAWVAPLGALLRARGFDRVRHWAGADGCVLRAEMPLHGRLSCV